MNAVDSVPLDDEAVTNAFTDFDVIDMRVQNDLSIRIDEDAYHVTISGEPLDLTYTEFELLRYLVQHQGKVLTREVLLSKVWGYDYFGGTRTVDVHIRRLRAKLGQFDHFIGTVRNVGYRFAARWEDHDA